MLCSGTHRSLRPRQLQDARIGAPPSDEEAESEFFFRALVRRILSDSAEPPLAKEKKYLEKKKRGQKNSASISARSSPDLTNWHVDVKVDCVSRKVFREGTSAGPSRVESSSGQRPRMQPIVGFCAELVAVHSPATMATAMHLASLPGPSHHASRSQLLRRSSGSHFRTSPTSLLSVTTLADRTTGTMWTLRQIRSLRFGASHIQVRFGASSRFAEE